MNTSPNTTSPTQPCKPPSAQKSISDWSVDFLPGQLLLTQAKPSDYKSLAHFHYLCKKPATWAGVWAVQYVIEGSPDRIIAIGVLSYPSAVLRTRHRVFNLQHLTYGQRLKWVNQHIRTISRVIVHPQFRSLGLAVRLTQFLCEQCKTPYIEASARMGRAHPFFEKAGLTRVDPLTLSEPVYYWKKLSQGICHA